MEVRLFNKDVMHRNVRKMRHCSEYKGWENMIFFRTQ